MKTVNDIIEYWKGVGAVIVTDCNGHQHYGTITDMVDGFTVIKGLQYGVTYVETESIVSIKEM